MHCASFDSRNAITAAISSGFTQREKSASGMSARFGGEIPQLTVTRPSLEDTYLQLIGSWQDPVQNGVSR